MDAFEFDQLQILTIKKVTSADRLAKAAAALAASPSSADLIAAEKDARWRAEYAARKLDEQIERIEKQRQQDERWLQDRTEDVTSNILMAITLPSFFIFVGIGPLAAVFWSNEYRDFIKFSEHNSIASDASLIISFGWGLLMSRLLWKLLHGPIYDRIIAAKRRQQRP